MSKKTNQSHEEKAINKVEESIPRHTLDNQTRQEGDLHPVLIKLLEKSVQDAKAGKGSPHDEVMKRMKKKFSFLK